jgi:3-deoxy-7-phosphoheptulonate synthase
MEPKRAHEGEHADRDRVAGDLTRGVAVRDNPSMIQPTRDLRVRRFRPLLPPTILLEELPLSEAGSFTVTRGRAETVRILRGEDDRLVVVVGPCSVHDPAAGLDYAQRLRKLADEVAADLCIIMRVYFEKPRTTVGWKGLINDPRLDGSFVINEGLRLGRRFLLDLAEMGLPAGCEFLDPISPQFISDLVSWGAIGARTTESQVHRELASGLSMPVGFKNSTGGGVQVAVDAVRSAAHPHSFLGVTEQGLCAIVETTGNLDCHVILRGGHTGPNYDEPHVRKVIESLKAAGLPARIMIDTSHGNSSKDYRRQPLVARAVAEQVAAGETAIVGVMMESFLEEGRQELRPGVPPRYGQSITDACMSWEMTVPVLHELAQAIRDRRGRRT